MDYKISIIIPTYNRAHIIEGALLSVISQTYEHWECLIVDDGSTDTTEKIVQRYKESDQRFRYFTRPATRIKGAATCRNIGLENASGDFIQFLDSDDYLASNKFEVQIEQLKLEAKGTVATCRYGIQRQAWKYPQIFKGYPHFRSYKTPEKLLRNLAENFAYFPLHVYLVSKDLISRSGTWKEELSVNDDGEFFSRIILNCTGIAFCGDTYVVYRTGAGNRITGKMVKEEGVQAYMTSWEMVDRNIYEITGIANHLYVKAARRNLYKRLRKENSDLLNKYRGFLDEKWKGISYFYASFIHRLNRKLRYSYFIPKEDKGLKKAEKIVRSNKLKKN